MVRLSFDALLLDRASIDAERPLYVFDRAAPVSTGGFAKLAGRAAATLASLGVGPGDRIAVWGENSLGWLVLLAAASWRGAAVVTLHPALSVPELTTALGRSRVRGVFAAADVRGRSGEADIAAAVAGVPADLRPRGWHVYGDDLSVLPGWTDPAPAPVGRPDDPLNIQFTSGSTGTPKMVSLSSHNLIANAEWTARASRIDGRDRISSPAPLAHAAGLGSGALLALVTGALWVSARRFRPDDVLEQIARHRCTVLQAVPTMATMLADVIEADPGRFDLSSLRVGFFGGAPCAPALIERSRRVLGLDRVAVIYGQTEAGPSITVDPGDGDLGTPGTTAGRVLPQVSAMVVDPVTSAELPAGEPGELWVRSEAVTAGYVDAPEATRAALTEDGWLRTGDLGMLDADRVFHLTGRVKDLIIRGGENIGPAEIEAVLLECPGVAQACVLGIPSERWGEEVGALIVPAPGCVLDTDAIVVAVAARLSRHKVPTTTRVVSELPLLPGGKVDRRAARGLFDTGAR